MKLIIEDKEFKPFKLTIEIESEEDAQKIHFLCNHSDIIKALDLDEKFCREIRDLTGSETLEFTSSFHGFNNKLKKELIK